MKSIESYLTEASASKLKQTVSKSFIVNKTHVVQSKLKSWMYRGDPALSSMRVIPKQTSAEDMIEMIADERTHALAFIVLHDYNIANAFESCFGDDEKLLNAMIDGINKMGKGNPLFRFKDLTDEEMKGITQKMLDDAKASVYNSFGFRMWDVLDDGHLSKARTFIAFRGKGKFMKFNGIYLWNGKSLSKFD